MRNDRPIFSVPFMLSTSKRTSHKKNIMGIASQLLEFLKQHGLLCGRLRNYEQSFLNELIIHRSDLTDEGYQLFARSFVSRWLGAIDRGMPPSNIAILRRGMDELRASDGDTFRELNSRLILEDGTIRDSPGSDQIRADLTRLNPSTCSFAIFEKALGWYIQVGLQSSGDIIIEYRDGSPQEHYQAIAVEIDEVIPVIQDYARGGNSWKSMMRWKIIEA